LACKGGKGEGNVSAGEVAGQPAKNVIREADFELTEREGVPVSMNAILYPARMQVGGGNLYVSCFNCDTMVYVFSLPGLQLVQSVGIKGQGPDDFMFPVFCGAAEREVTLWGFADLRRVATYHAGPEGIGDRKAEFRLKENDAYNNSHLVKDSFFVYNLMPQEMGIGRIDLYNDMAIVKKTYPMDQDPAYSFYNSTMGTVAASDAGIAYLYEYRNEIDFYDTSLNMKSAKSSDKNRFHVDKQNREDNILYYLSAFAGERYLYALNYGDRQKSAARPSASLLEVYDWEGNRVGQFRLNPPLDLFVVDESSRTLYGYNAQLPDSFYKYSL
jgi:hypothetical protein